MSRVHRQSLEATTRPTMTERGQPTGHPKMLYGLPGGNQVDGFPPATSWFGERNLLLSHSGIQQTTHGG